MLSCDVCQAVQACIPPKVWYKFKRRYYICSCSAVSILAVDSDFRCMGGTLFLFALYCACGVFDGRYFNMGRKKIC